MKSIYARTFDSPIRVKKISNTRFVRCKFIDTELPNLSNCKFDNCEFIRTKICYSTSQVSLTAQTSNRNKPETRAHSMTNCSFSFCHISECELKNANISETTFIHCKFETIQFFSCLFDGELLIRKCKGISTLVIDEETTFSESFSEIIDGSQPSLFRRLISWGGIRFLSRVPIPKVGMSFFAIVLIMVPVYNFLVVEFCNVLVVESAIARCMLASIEIGRDQETVVTLFWVLVFLIASVLHALFEPETISKCDRATWRLSMNSSVLRWDTENYSRPWMMSFVLLLYCVSAGFLVQAYFEKFYPLLYF